MSRPTFRPHLLLRGSKLGRCALLGALMISAAGCTTDKAAKSSASGSPSDDGSAEPEFVGPPTRMTWTLYKTGQQITLVNERHTDRLEFYSETRGSASTKVQTDEILAALVEFCDDEGFEKYAQSGSAPAAAIGQASQALEVEVDGQRRYMLWGVDRPEKERACFVKCRDGLTEIWNATYAAQAVDNERGESVFGTSASTKKKGR